MDIFDILTSNIEVQKVNLKFKEAVRIFSLIVKDILVYLPSNF